MKSIGLILNIKNPPMEFANELIQWFSKKHYQIVMLSSDALQISHPDICYVPHFDKPTEFVVALGGDGTFLRASRLTAPYNIPILAINNGHFGFLSELNPSEVFSSLETILKGHYSLDQRTMICSQVQRENSLQPCYTGLNDVIIHRGRNSPLLTVHIQIADEDVASFRGDGVIVATPTGSTGYSLSAGGPIIHPSARGLLVTPICSHGLFERPIIISDHELVRIRLENISPNLNLLVDGQTEVPLQENDLIVIQTSKHMASFIRIHDYHFFSVLQKKFK